VSEYHGGRSDNILGDAIMMNERGPDNRFLKGTSNFSPNPMLELLFAKNARANCSKNTSSLAHRASNNRNEVVAHPTGHDNAHFERTQQPTNNPTALV
jgi:hypothetical protein